MKYRPPRPAHGPPSPGRPPRGEGRSSSTPRAPVYAKSMYRASRLSSPDPTASPDRDTARPSRSEPGRSGQPRVTARRFLSERLRANVLALVVGILVLGFGTLLGLNLGRERVALERQHREAARLLLGLHPDDRRERDARGAARHHPPARPGAPHGAPGRPPDRRVPAERRRGVHRSRDGEEVNANAGLEPALIGGSAAAARARRAPQPPAVRAGGPDHPAPGDGGDGRRGLVLTLFRPAPQPRAVPGLPRQGPPGPGRRPDQPRPGALSRRRAAHARAPPAPGSPA